MALILNNSESIKADSLLARASHLEYVTLLFLEIQSILKESAEY